MFVIIGAHVRLVCIVACDRMWRSFLAVLQTIDEQLNYTFLLLAQNDMFILYHDFILCRNVAQSPYTSICVNTLWSWVASAARLTISIGVGATTTQL